MKVFSAAILLLFISACGEPLETSGEAKTKASDISAELAARRSERIAVMASAHDGNVDFKDTYNALDPRLKRSGVVRGSFFDASDDYWGLPRTNGYEEVAINCAGCHSLQIVMQQRVTADRWAYLLEWMVEKQGMIPLEGEEIGLVEEYLNAHFSSTMKE